MLVEFRSDDVMEWEGFSTFIHYSSLPSKECQKGLDMTKKTIQSPKYPDSYDNNLTCKWLISIPHGFHITLKFLEFDVKILFSNLNEESSRSNDCDCRGIIYWNGGLRIFSILENNLKWV